MNPSELQCNQKFLISSTFRSTEWMKIDFSCPKKKIFISLVRIFLKLVSSKKKKKKKSSRKNIHGIQAFHYTTRKDYLLCEADEMERRSSWFLGVNSFNLSLPLEPREGEKEEGRSGRSVPVRSRTSSTSSSFRGRATTISRKYIGIEVKRIVTIQLLDPLDPVMHRATVAVGPFWEVVADFRQPLVSRSGRVLRLVTGLCWSTPPCPFTPIPPTNCLHRAFPSRFLANKNFYQVWQCCFTFVCSFCCSFFKKFCNGYMGCCIGSGIFLSFFLQSIDFFVVQLYIIYKGYKEDYAF